MSKQSEKKNEAILSERRKGSNKIDKEVKKKLLIVQPLEVTSHKTLGKSSRKKKGKK